MKELSKKEDKALVRLIRTNKNQKAYAVLLDRYKNALLHTTLKLIHNRDDADDIVIKAFTKAFKNIEQYNDQYAFSTWLFKIASNLSIDFLRKKRLPTTSLDKQMKKTEEKGLSFAQNIKDSAPTPEEEYSKQKRNEIIKGVIETIPPKYSELIKMRFFQELKYEEIATALELPLGTVKVRLSRAKDLLKEILKEHKDKL